MGLLNFIKDVGDKFSGKLDGKAIEEKIKNELGSQIIEIKAEVNGHEVILSGLCENNDAREKAVLIAGNNKGIGAVNYFNFRVKESPKKASEAKEQVHAEAPQPTPSAEVSVQKPSPEVSGQQRTAEAEAVKADSIKTETEFYQIVEGDTLSKIAKKFYGNANKYPIIFEANREVIKHPDKIYVGQTIRIPKNV